MGGMPRLLDLLAPLYVWLFALDPMLPQALFVSLVFFTVWLLRKLAPNKWEAFANLIHVKSDDTAWWQNELRALWQMLPAAIIGTIYGLLGTGADPWPTLKATLLALLAPVVHRIAARYKGQVGAVAKAAAPLLVCLLLGLSVAGCGAFSKVTPVDRADAYTAQARAAELACRAYVFDRAGGLVGEVPSMTKLCSGE